MEQMDKNEPDELWIDPMRNLWLPRVLSAKDVERVALEREHAEEYILSFSGHYIKGDKVQSDGSVRKAAEIEVLLSG